MNSDFRDFINRVNKDIRNNEIYKEQYDKVLDKEKLLLLTKKWRIASCKNRIKPLKY